VSAAPADRLRALIREVPEFPQPGILFRDITPLLADASAFREAVGLLAAAHREGAVDVVAGIESRGFMLGGAVAHALGTGFIPIRKEGRLPAAKLSTSYELEYGRAVVEIHSDAIRRGQRVLIVDDLLATGGTAAAAVSLVEQLGGVVIGVAFLVELTALGGAAALAGRPFTSIIRF
jgi:adenine phosphoribosyltransferase